MDEDCALRSLIGALILLAGCSQEAQQPKQAQATTPAKSSVAPGAQLAGLYERAGANAVADRICVTGGGDAARFGLVTWGGNDHSCTARGRVSSGALVLEGGPACTVRATAGATGLTVGAGEGAGCSYYCGARATLTAGEFVKIGSAAADIAKVVDVAGDPVCT